MITVELALIERQTTNKTTHYRHAESGLHYDKKKNSMSVFIQEIMSSDSRVIVFSCFNMFLQ